MKQFIIIAAALSLFLAPLHAQQGGKMYDGISMIASKAYSNSAVDTTRILKAGAFEKLSLWIQANDSTKMDIYVDTKPLSGQTWTQTYSDSLITASNSGLVQEYILRNNIIERCGSLTSDIRFRFSFRAAGNGVSSAAYSVRMYFKR